MKINVLYVKKIFLKTKLFLQKNRRLLTFNKVVFPPNKSLSHSIHGGGVCVAATYPGYSLLVKLVHSEERGGGEEEGRGGGCLGGLRNSAKEFGLKRKSK